MTPRLTPSLEESVETHDGGPIRVPGKQTSYVVMSTAVYRELLKLLPNERALSRSAIDRGLADVRAGNTRPWKDVLHDLTQSL